MHFRKYLLTGLMVWLPLAITIGVLMWLVGVLNGVFGGFLTGVAAVTPDSLGPFLERLRHIPGLGVFLVVSVLFFTGALVSNVAGRWVVNQWDRFFANVPIVKSIYNSVKKVSDTLFSEKGNAFRWGYTLKLPVDGRIIEVQFDDWMYLMTDKVMLNKAVMSKFGFKLGEVTLSFVKRAG